MMLLDRCLPLFSPDAGGAAAANGQAAAVDGGTPDPSRAGLNALAGGGANGAANGAAADGPTGYWPDTAKELAETYRGQDDKGTIEKLIADIQGRERPPAAAKDYKLELPADIAKKFPDMAKDPVLDIWRDVSHKNGFTDKQFNGALTQLYGELVEKGLMDAPIDVDAEIEKLMPKRGTETERNAEARKRINTVHDTVDGLVTNGTLSKSEAKYVKGLAATADGVIALEKLLKSRGEHGLQPGGQGVGSLTKETLLAQMNDPRYDSRGSKYDKNYRNRVDADWRRLHGQA